MNKEKKCRCRSECPVCLLPLTQYQVRIIPSASPTLPYVLPVGVPLSDAGSAVVHLDGV